MTRPIRVAYALLRAASAFVSALARGADAPVRARPSESRRALPPHPPSPGLENKCPVCQARFRGVRICSRCGADLEPLMLLAVKSWQLRQAARGALQAGEVERALKLAIEAQSIQQTGRGDALRLLGAWLTTV